MRHEIDTLMESNNLDALLITGPAQHNPHMVYMTGIAHLTNADLIKKRGSEAMLYYNSAMERDEAARSKYKIKNLADFDYPALLKQAGGDPVKAVAARYQRILEENALTSGRIGLYGKSDAGSSYAVFSALQQAMPSITLVGELNNSLLLSARMTKDADELEHIRRMGAITTQVVGLAAEYLASHKAQQGVLVKKDGQPLTIGEVKGKINLWLGERGAENPEGTIFAIGRDAGVPHSAGEPSDLLRLGETIVFDIFPCQEGGGYYYDFTRTWCLGYAPDEALKIYEQVYEVYQKVTASLSQGMLFSNAQELTCDLFEAQGHTTIRSNPQSSSGYIHSVGHGLGLNIHERPWSGIGADDQNRLLPGTVFTIEPGLYYPENGLGVRLENSLWVRPDGQMEVFADYPMDLVIPIKTSRARPAAGR